MAPSICLLLCISMVMTMSAKGHVTENNTRETDDGPSRLEFDLAMLRKTVHLQKEISQLVNDQILNVRRQLGDMQDQVDVLDLLNDVKEEVDVISTTSSPLLLTTTTTTTLSRCPNGWITYNESCYLFGSKLLSFSAAKTFCEEQGGYLVRLQTQDENEFLKKIMLDVVKGGSLWWIGMTDVEKEGEWKIVGENTTVPFFDWGGSQPNNYTGEDCAVFSSGLGYKWADYNCLYTSFAVCEKIKYR